MDDSPIPKPRKRRSKAETMTSPQSTTPISYEQLRQYLFEITETIKRIKVQTGELADTRDQIRQIDRSLRGFNGEMGLLARFVILEQSMTGMIKEQIPEMLEDITSAVKEIVASRNELNTCKLHHDVDTQTAKAELDRLRREDQAHIDSEAKEEGKFGGRDWFRENASTLFMSAVTLILNALVMYFIVSRLIPPIP